MASEKGCKICHVVDVPLDKDRRCKGCADARYAALCGMKYGDFYAWRETRRERMKKSNPAAYEKLKLADDGGIELAKCKACGEWIWDGRRKDSCSKECEKRLQAAEARKRRYRRQDDGSGQTWELDEPLFE